MIRCLTALPLLALAACQPPAAGDSAAPTPAATATGEDYLARIAALPPAQRQMVLFRAIRDSGKDCQNVTRVEPLPAGEGRALWRVTCRGGGQWAVAIGRDGTATVAGPPGA